MPILSSRKRCLCTQTEKTKKILFSLFLNELCTVARFYKYRVFLYSWTSPQRPPWGQEKVAVVESYKQEPMYVLSAKKMAVVER